VSEEKVTWDEIKDMVVYTEKVAHVTFYVVKDKTWDDRYLVYSESKKRGLHVIPDEEHFIEYFNPIPVSYDDALAVLRKSILDLEGALERKRDEIPTPKQLHFLFCHKIPIPLTLTWGQASDLIDEQITRSLKEKQAKQDAKTAQFKGFTVGMEVCQSSTVRYPDGKSHMQVLLGEITKLTSSNAGDKYAWVKWTSDIGQFEDRVSINVIKPFTAEIKEALRIAKEEEGLEVNPAYLAGHPETLQRILHHEHPFLLESQREREALQKLREGMKTGARVHHVKYGDGTVLEHSERREDVYIGFDSGVASGWYSPTNSKIFQIIDETSLPDWDDLPEEVTQ